MDCNVGESVPVSTVVSGATALPGDAVALGRLGRLRPAPQCRERCVGGDAAHGRGEMGLVCGRAALLRFGVEGDRTGCRRCGGVCGE